MKPVRKAVFPVAGLGTRFLPATKAIPKEMLTVVDRPLIQYAVDEAREAGIEQMIFVTGRGKSALVDYFDMAFELETTMRAKGDTGNFVYVSNTTPVMDMAHGFQLAVADDAANQLLTSLWSAKGLDQSLMLENGSYGEIGTLFDSVQLEAKVPPYVNANDGKLQLTVGDLLAVFKNGQAAVTAVAINAQVDLKVVEGSDGKLRFDVGEPTMYVDILDEQAARKTSETGGDLKAVRSEALAAGRLLRNRARPHRQRPGSQRSQPKRLQQTVASSSCRHLRSAPEAARFGRTQEILAR